MAEEILNPWCVWLTGLSGSGKTTIAEKLVRLIEGDGRAVTLLDGDVVRKTLGEGLGFSMSHRRMNVRRVSFVAREIVKHGGIVVCALISPYRSMRAEVRAELRNRFVEVFVDTPLEVCEKRDVKGLYKKARAGEIPLFTGISDPYEPPPVPEIHLTTVGQTPLQNARTIFEYLIWGRGSTDGGVCPVDGLDS